MKINSLLLKDWRNGKDTFIEFSPSVTLITGENAAGKTNILECVSYFASGKSFRGCKDKELVRFGETAALGEIGYTARGLDNTLSVRITKGTKKKLYKNGVEITKLSQFLGEFRCVIFTPDHLNLVKGSPDGRRRFTDMAICQSFPRYVAALNEYNRILMQKNAHLKGLNPVPELLDVYDSRMAFLSGNISVNRKKYLKLLGEYASAFLFDMSGQKEEMELQYVSQVKGETAEEISAEYAQLFKNKRETECEKHACLYGPQKDDFCININKKSAKLYASQGQQRSAVLALKLAEGEISKQLTGEYPVYLLDDVLSELDEGRRGYILKRITDRQVIITGCDVEDMLKSDKVYRVENGICSLI